MTHTEEKGKVVHVARLRRRGIAGEAGRGFCPCLASLGAGRVLSPRDGGSFEEWVAFPARVSPDPCLVRRQALVASFVL